MNQAIQELVDELNRLHAGLDKLSYYEFLGVAPSCDYVAIRDAFYLRAQRLHPDRFVVLDEEHIKRVAYDVYKRITEAYNVLSDPELRRSYDNVLGSGEPRLAAEARARRLDSDERGIGSPFARIYLRSARSKLERGDVSGAWVDVELGLSIEQALPLRALQAELVRRMAGEKDRP